MKTPREQLEDFLDKPGLTPDDVARALADLNDEREAEAKRAAAAQLRANDILKNRQ